MQISKCFNKALQSDPKSYVPFVPLRVMNKSLESDCGIPAYTSNLTTQKYPRYSAPPIMRIDREIFQEGKNE